jgi:transposase-like protein
MPAMARCCSRPRSFPVATRASLSNCRKTARLGTNTELGRLAAGAESSIAELCRREGIAEGLYYSWSKEFLEAGKRRLAGDTARAATSSEVTDLRREARTLKEVVAEQALELRLLKKA